MGVANELDCAWAYCLEVKNSTYTVKSNTYLQSTVAS